MQCAAREQAPQRHYVERYQRLCRVLHDSIVTSEFGNISLSRNLSHVRTRYPIANKPLSCCTSDMYVANLMSRASEASHFCR